MKQKQNQKTSNMNFLVQAAKDVNMQEKELNQWKEKFQEAGSEHALLGQNRCYGWYTHSHLFLCGLHVKILSEPLHTGDSATPQYLVEKWTPTQIRALNIYPIDLAVNQVYIWILSPKEQQRW